MSPKPEYLQQGEVARLFPVLATTSKEGRTTSILLSCLSRIDEFGKAMLESIGRNVGSRSVISTYTEIVFKGVSSERDRPDGLIVVRVGRREWRAIVEAKVGHGVLKEEQIEKYRCIARDQDIDCVITISNQFATSAQNHPLTGVRRSRSRIPVFHWSWMFILTTADLLLNNDDIEDPDQAQLLFELRRFLSHESAGVKGFDRMPGEWAELNRLVSAGGKVSARSADATTVLDAWHQETRDLALILSRQVEVPVREKLSRRHARDPGARLKDEIAELRETNRLCSCLDIPNAAAPLEIVCDLSRRSIDVGMTIRAPEDRQSSKARVNWLLKQVKTELTEDLNVRLNWRGRSEDTQFTLSEIRDDLRVIEEGKQGQQLYSFHIFFARRLGARFAQQTKFITELEKIVPEFYREVGQNLSPWREIAPRVRPDRDTAEDVSVKAISVETVDL